MPVVQPIGGHAVYIDGRAFAPHLPPEQFPAQALTIALYREGGIRAVEIGGVMFGRPDPQRPGRKMLPDLDLVRLAVRRRVYTNTHLEYVAEVAVRLHREPQALRGVRIVRQAPVLRHFTARFELIRIVGRKRLAVSRDTQTRRMAYGLRLTAYEGRPLLQFLFRDHRLQHRRQAQ